MTQALYAHMNNKTINKKKKKYQEEDGVLLETGLVVSLLV
jgi:hypothetical protein